MELPRQWSNFKTKRSGMIFADVLTNKFGSYATILVKKKCFQEVGLYDESFPCAEDLEMVLRLSWRYPFKYLDEKLYNYRIFKGNIKNRLSQSSLSYYRASAIEKHFRRGKSTLTPGQRQSVTLDLTKDFRTSSQRMKMLRYGLGSYRSFRYLLSVLVRGDGLGRNNRSAQSP